MMANDSLDKQISELVRDLEKYEKKIETELDKALVEGAIDILAETVKNTPVDKGQLIKSMTYVLDDSGVDIGTNVEYAEKVEFTAANYHIHGQVKFMPKGAMMLTNAFSLKSPKAYNRIKKAIGDVNL